VALPWNSIKAEDFKKLTQKASAPSASSGIPNVGISTQRPRMVGSGVTPTGSDFSTKTVTNQPKQTSPVSGFGGFTYGTDPAKSKALESNINLWKTDANAKQKEIERTLSVRDQLRAEGKDYSAQDKHLYGTLGYKDPSKDTTIQPEQPDYKWLEDQVMNELEAQSKAIMQELERFKQDNQFAVSQNENWLSEQMKRLEENRIKAGAEIKDFQNRRGGFYSGGTDYQLATNNDSSTEAKENVTREIGARNADIWSKYNQLAQQASEKITMLTSQAPSKIRELIEAQKAKDAAAQLEANKFALDQNKFAWNQYTDTQDLALRDRAQTLDETEVIARLTGFTPDGQPTTDQQKFILDTAWKTIAEIGYVPANLASVVGVPAGTKTQDAIRTAIQQQNANTSAYSAQTSRMNAENKDEPISDEEILKYLK